MPTMQHCCCDICARCGWISNALENAGHDLGSEGVRDLQFGPPLTSAGVEKIIARPPRLHLRYWPEAKRSPANPHTAVVLKDASAGWRDFRDPSDKAARTLFSRYESNLTLDHFRLHIARI